MRGKFAIGSRVIGEGEKPLIVAELGINHGGSLVEAMRIADAAASAGVEVLKHQTHIASEEMSKLAKSVVPGNSQDSIYSIIEKCSLSETEERLLQSYVQELGMIFISTPFSRAAADRLYNMNVPVFKIGSGECSNYPLIKHIAEMGKPIILSTGMNTIESVRKSVEILEGHSLPYALLHTTNLYPTPYRLVRLGAMLQLKNEFPNAIIGLSDHTVDNFACLAAVALGANILERHFTDSVSRIGPDIVNSMDPRPFVELKQGVEAISEMLGGYKAPAPEEHVTIDFAFATVVAIREIAQGEVFSKENLWVKRPGIGEIVAEELEGLYGKKATRRIEFDEHLKWQDIDRSE
jgi:N-acetylneuraminate synthase